MKRFRLEDNNNNSINIANVLMLISRGSNEESTAGRVFECKTCNRQFPSFQALGGHRASHKKPRLLPNDDQSTKPRVHGCSICGVEFAIGQALGGHMRRHRGNGTEGFGHGGKKVVKSFDLNLPASDDGSMECRNLGLGLGLELVCT